MKIIQERPGFEVRCRQCNSVYLIEHGDVIAKEDILLGKINDGAPDLVACWDCPVCGNQNGKWLYELPAEWRKIVRHV